jgi:hypothetical protein
MRFEIPFADDAIQRPKSTQEYTQRLTQIEVAKEGWDSQEEEASI